MAVIETGISPDVTVGRGLKHDASKGRRGTSQISPDVPVGRGLNASSLVSMSLRLAIPWRVAVQQSPPPLQQPNTILIGTR